MPGVISKYGSQWKLSIMVAAWNGVPITDIDAYRITYHLYQNNFTPPPSGDYVISDLLSDYIVECDFPGYSPVTAINWTPPLITADIALPKAYTTADPITWRRAAGPGAPQNIYGHYATWPGGLAVFHALLDERDPAPPVVIGLEGQVYTILPRMEDYTG